MCGVYTRCLSGMCGVYWFSDRYTTWIMVLLFVSLFFQAEDGIRDLVRSRGLGDVYKRQLEVSKEHSRALRFQVFACVPACMSWGASSVRRKACLLYTSDAADERSSVDLGGRRIIKKKKGHTSGDGVV